MKIILLTKKTDYCRRIQDIVKKDFPDVNIFEGEFGDPIPNINIEEDSIIISFLCPWIIPAPWLEKAKLAINFHPASPKYPGIGCYNFAIYHQDKEFGATCHHMNPKVDSGKIIKVLKFPISNKDTVFTLKQKTMAYLSKLFYEVFECLISEKQLSESDEVWLRDPYTRKDLQQLCKITKEMDEKEIKLRIKATFFSGARDQPYIELVGRKFVLKDD